jgi:hypothetical protein
MGSIAAGSATTKRKVDPMPILGGDLGAMSSLSSRFNSAGALFQSQSTTITQRVATALEEFTQQMAVLDGEARTLAAEIDGEMRRLSAQAAATEWTGENRAKADKVVAALDDDIVAIRSAVERFVEEASGVVKGSLTTNMNELKDKVSKSGSASQAAADGFSSSVARQRASFDTVMNG